MDGRVLAFDSGIGGLSIVGALRVARPGLRIDYLADNAIYPYGELSDEVLIARLEHLLDAAIDRFSPDVVLIACNTASTIALEAMRARFAVPFVGCVPPIKWAASLSVTRTIGLLATKATVRRRYLRDLQTKFAPDCTLIAYGERALADIAEATFRGRAIDRDLMTKELNNLFGQPGGDAIDVVGIGCTHYSVLLHALQDFSRPGITWLDPAQAVAMRTLAVLDSNEPTASFSFGSAWFTSPLQHHDPLASRLAPFGYGGTNLFEISPPSIGRRRSLLDRT